MPNTLTEWLAVWFILSVIATPFLGHWLRKQFKRYRVNRDFNRELHLVLNREALLAAVRKDLADEQGKLEPDYAYRARMKARADALGFIEEDDFGPFGLDENEQPHKPAA